ncbi:MAG: hypothetical protein U0610_21465 [bacterium]
MHELYRIVSFAAVVALGLTAGALLAEAGLLVPFWRSAKPEVFLAWYREHAQRLVRFFGPLEIAAAVSAGLAALLGWIGNHPNAALLAAAAFGALAVLATFPLYFQRANASFASGSISLAGVPDELRRWAHWHFARTGIAIAAFACAVFG